MYAENFPVVEEDFLVTGMDLTGQKSGSRKLSSQ